MANANQTSEDCTSCDRLAAERLRTILRSEPECVKSIDRDRRLLDMNPAGLRMIEVHSLDEVKGADVLDLVIPEFHEIYAKAVERVFAGKTVRQRYQIRGMKGTLRWMEQTAAPIFADDGSGQVVEMLAVTRDVTEQVELELELRAALQAAKESNKAKSRFLANTSHEIRTPLNGIVGGIQILKSMNLPESAAEFIDIVDSSAGALLNIVNDILDYSKLGASGIDMKTRNEDVRKTVDSAVALFKPMALEKGLKFQTEIEVPHPFIGTDHSRARQILNNYLSNAIKFTDTGTVSVRVTQKDLEGGLIETLFEVSDTGIGIPADMLQTVFEPFFQVEQTHSRHYGGTGLGLAICRELARHMGGDCGVASKPGEGSTFWLYLHTDVAAEAAPELRTGS